MQKGLAKVEDWRYFTIFAPRQSGKTTYFQFLIDAIRKQKPEWLPIWISFESYGNIEPSYFLSSLRDRILRRLENQEQSILPFESIDEIASQIRDHSHRQARQWVLIIDEVEGLKNPEILNGFLHLIRSIYHEKQAIGLRSVILTGVSNITGILQDSASPFNIADQIQVPYFTREEVLDLLAQHERETEIGRASCRERVYSNV